MTRQARRQYCDDFNFKDFDRLLKVFSLLLVLKEKEKDNSYLIAFIGCNLKLNYLYLDINRASIIKSISSFLDDEYSGSVLTAT